MVKLYKAISETTNYGRGNDVLTLKVGDTFEGDTNGSIDVVYTTIDKKAPDFSVVGQSYVAVPLSSVKETTLAEGVLPASNNTKKWMWIIGLTLAAWGLLYWSQKEKK